MNNMNISDLFKKYAIVTNGIKRFYVINLSDRVFSLENCVPIQLVVNSDISFEENSWTNLLVKVAQYLQEKYRINHQELYNFRPIWSDKPVFTYDQRIDNCKLVESDLYISHNYSNSHIMWLIYDLFVFYEVDCAQSHIYINRFPDAEPKEVKTAVETYIRERFETYLEKDEQISSKLVQKILNSFNTFNKIVSKTNSSFKNCYLIQDTIKLQRYIDLLRKESKKYFNSEQIVLLEKYVGYYRKFFNAIVCEPNVFNVDNAGISNPSITTIVIED